MTTDSDRRFADLAMKAANERTHQQIEIAELKERIAALEAAARAVVDELCDQTVPKGTTLWCDWCDSTPIGSTDPRCEERAPMQHYAECPVGVLAALVLPVEVGKAAKLGLDVARDVLGDT